MEDKRKRVQELKKEKDAVLMAHYYVEQEVQEVADYIGDSYYLAKQAAEVEAGTIVLCGVSFMGESAKVLNEKKDRASAGCACGLSHGPHGRSRADSQGEGSVSFCGCGVLCEFHSRAEKKRGCVRDLCKCAEDREGASKSGNLLYTG